MPKVMSGARSVRTYPVLMALALAVTTSGCAGGSQASTSEQDEGAPSDNNAPEDSLEEHPLLETSADEAPSVELKAEPDTYNGWNLRLLTENFEFTPEDIGDEARDGAGHGHLYINGEKYMRVYSEWAHLPAAAVPEGEHVLVMTLNANDHSTWAVDGQPIQAETQVTGTGVSEGQNHDH
ncbi:hypothetical protein [Allosalinactinospora lopnorensis]|uniref:hypothetical protein n=1 Tax=Allosalinactinospora lopnorensis TaxID=1352348 RepID=UPI000695DE2D|nr:hypothetical protein [Allosalinactinospora lopnorensis]